MADPKQCEACGYAATVFNPLVKTRDGKHIHNSHFTDKNSSFYGKKKA